jgi:hypothetical protein
VWLFPSPVFSLTQYSDFCPLYPMRYALCPMLLISTFRIPTSEFETLSRLDLTFPPSQPLTFFHLPYAPCPSHYAFNFQLPHSDFPLPTLPTSKFLLPNSHLVLLFRLPTSHFQIPISFFFSDFRIPTSHFPLTPGFQPNRTGNPMITGSILKDRHIN